MSFADDIKKAIEETSVDNIRRATRKALFDLGNNIVNDAKENLRSQGAANTGALIGSIYASQAGNKPYELDIIAGADYAPYIEFGTRKYAAKYVSSLPKEWQDLAAQSKGKKSGSFEDMVKALTLWVSQKGITGTYSVKTRKRLGSKSKNQNEDMKVAYAIAKRILINGIRPRPYLYPAVTKNVNKFAEEFDKIFK